MTTATRTVRVVCESQAAANPRPGFCPCYRYPPIPQEEWTPEQRAVAQAIVDGPRGELRGPFVPLLHAPALAAKVQELGAVIRFQTGIPNALLEMAVCMTARARDCPYIWTSHSRAAMKAGLAPTVLAAVARRERPADMRADEALVHAFCNELLDKAKVSDATFAATEARWGKKGAMELAGICGYYGMLACCLTVADWPLSAGAEPYGVP